MRHAQRAVLLTVVVAADAEDVAVLDRRAVGVGLLTEEVERQLGLAVLRLRGRKDGAVAGIGALAAQMVAGVDHELLGAIGEELLVGVIAQHRLEALEEVVVLGHGGVRSGRRAGRCTPQQTATRRSRRAGSARPHTPALVRERAGPRTYALRRPPDLRQAIVGAAMSIGSASCRRREK